jgi:hypothetical protein
MEFLENKDYFKDTCLCFTLFEPLILLYRYAFFFSLPGLFVGRSSPSFLVPFFEALFLWNAASAVPLSFPTAEGPASALYIHTIIMAIVI